MTNYKLTKITDIQSGNLISCKADIKNRFFFRNDDDTCYTLQSQINYMIENGLVKLTLFLAERETKSDYFFCKHFEETGDKSEGGCGKLCDAYTPRNGKSGVCKYYGFMYSQTERCYILELPEDVVFPNHN